MKNINILLGIFFAICFSSFSQKEMKSMFPLKWKADIGITTYRTNMIEYKGLLYIGSNGEDRESKLDVKDGVYAIDVKSGEVKYHYQIPFAGDNDVTGIAIGNDKLYFGSDNYYFFCFDLKTHQELWKYHIPYDVESCPVLADLNEDKILDVSFNVQGDGFYALNGQNGELLWLNEEISSHNGNVSPQLWDLDNDGVMDIITAGRGESNSDKIDGFKMAHYGDYHFALNGKTGKILWAVESGAGIHSSPFIHKTANGIEIYLLDCYGELNIVDASGKLLKQSYFSYGIFSSPIVTKDEHLAVGDFSVEINQKYFERDSDSIPYQLSDRASFHKSGNEGPFSATTMVADVLGKGFPQLISVSEKGLLLIAKTDGTVLHQLKIPTGAEASVFIKDTDSDGKLEIIVADLNGTLFCYKTNSSGKVEYGEFRKQ